MRTLSIVVLTLLLTGCYELGYKLGQRLGRATTEALDTSTPATAADFASTLTSKLCMDYLTIYPTERHQRGREEALRARGEDCSAYVNAAERRKSQASANEAASKAAHLKSLRTRMNKQNNPAPSPSGIKTHTYMYQGRIVTCTTTGGMTDCM